jgi:lactate dehydrogenase-like 2-hydroxyacid dehydrogenase
MHRPVVLAMPKLPPEAVGLLHADFDVYQLPAGSPGIAIPTDCAKTIRAIATPGRDPGNGRLGAEIFDQLPGLEVISSFSSGLDGIDVANAMARGIRVGHAPDVLAEPVADIALALAIDLARGMSSGQHYVRAGLWASKGATPLATSMAGKVAGILGLGRIGKALARRLVACGLTVVYTGRKKQANVPYAYIPGLIELAQASDFLFCCCPATPETNQIVNGDVLRAMGASGFLVNVSRGSVVDEEALILALRNNTIAGGGLDVCQNEPHVDPRLLDFPNLVLLPHLGASTVEARAEMFEVMLENLRLHFAGSPLRYPYGQP